jgi:hypothetical protein
VCFSLAIEGEHAETFASVHKHPIRTEHVQTFVLCEYKFYWITVVIIFSIQKSYLLISGNGEKTGL